MNLRGQLGNTWVCTEPCAYTYFSIFMYLPIFPWINMSSGGFNSNPAQTHFTRTPLPKPIHGHYQKQKPEANIPDEHRCKNPARNAPEVNSTTHSQTSDTVIKQDLSQGCKDGTNQPCGSARKQNEG